MPFRRPLALLGPLTACGALLVLHPARGDWLVLVLVLAIAVPVLRANPAGARTACVAGGFGLGVVALRGLLEPPGEALGIGLWLTLAGGVATVVAGVHPDIAAWRRLLALCGPITTIAALSLPWWLEPFTISGWDTLAVSDWVLSALCLAAAGAAVAAPREHARAACLACGVALVTVAGWDLMLGADEFAWQAGMALTGPVVAIAGGLGTTIAGLVLYPPRRSASSLITAS